MTSTQSGPRLCLWAHLQPLQWLISWSNSFPDGESHGPLPLTMGRSSFPLSFSSYLAAKGVAHIRTAFYRPQANGSVERFNQSLKNGIRAHLAQGFPFKAALSQTLLHYRAIQPRECPLPVSCLAGN